MIIDELPNTAPIPNLPKIVGEGRGLGINLVAAVQASSSLARVYGQDIAEELRHIFGAAVIMFGAREDQILEDAQTWSPLTNRRNQQFGQADGHKSLSSELGPSLRWEELLPPTREHARVLVRGGVGVCAEIPDWSEFLRRYDTAISEILSRTAGRENAGATQHSRAAGLLRRLWSDTRNDAEL